MAGAGVTGGFWTGADVGDSFFSLCMTGGGGARGGSFCPATGPCSCGRLPAGGCVGGATLFTKKEPRPTPRTRKPKQYSARNNGRRRGEAAAVPGGASTSGLGARAGEAELC